MLQCKIINFTFDIYNEGRKEAGKMNIDESNFIKELKSKNPRALDYLIDQYSPLIKGIIEKVIGGFKDEGLREECMSDVLMAIWENSIKYDENKGSFKNWMGAVTKFKAIDYYRKYNKFHELRNEIDENLTDGVSTEDRFMVIFESNKLINIIEAQEEPDRTIFTMKFLLDESTKKISQVVKLSVSTVNTRISRGREKLKRAYYKENGGESYNG